MDRYLVITVDTEADWYNPEQLKLRNITAIPDFQDECVQYGFIPTYLVTYEVASRDESLSVLQPIAGKKLCEIGHHLHVWSTPPFETPSPGGTDSTWMHGLQSELPDPLFEAKMLMLHNTIRKNFGLAPTSHRAGRWAIDTRTLKWLSGHNYLADSSMTARKTWWFTRGKKTRIGVNSARVSNNPYFPSLSDITMPATRDSDRIGILEIPVSAAGTAFGALQRTRGFGLFSAGLNKTGCYRLGMVSFRPSYPVPDALFSRWLERLFQSDLKVVNFMFHSNELHTGTSPYSRTENRTADVRKRIRKVMDTARSYGFSGISLSGYAALIKRADDQERS